MLKRISFFLALIFVFPTFVLSAEKLCYQIVESQTTTRLELITTIPANNELYPITLTVFEEKNGQAIAEPFKMYGRIDKEQFILPDGSIFELGKKFRLISPANGPMAGLDFLKTDCATK